MGKEKDDNQENTEKSKGYTAPRATPHPDETPISPYDTQKLTELEHTKTKMHLIRVAGNIRSTEANLNSLLSKIGKSSGGDLRKVTINPRQPTMMKDPMRFSLAKRAKTAQQNLESYYKRWATLCEEHEREIHYNHNS